MITKISANMATMNSYKNNNNAKAPAFKGSLIVTAKDLEKVGEQKFDAFLNNLDYFYFARQIGTIADLVKSAEPNKLTAKFSFGKKFNSAVQESIESLNSGLKEHKLENDIEIKYLED